MKEPALLKSLLIHTGNLRPGPGVTNAELSELRHLMTLSLLQGQLPDDIGPAISKTEVEPNVLEELEELVTNVAAAPPAERFRVARRDFGMGGPRTADWAIGMQPQRTLGPFIDDFGRQFWFDLFLMVKPFRVSRGSGLLLVLPIGTRKKPNEPELEIPAGTVWIRANQLAAGPTPASWTGVRVKGGVLDVPEGSTVTNDTLSIPVPALITLHIELDPPSLSGTESGPGSEATKAVAKVPAAAAFTFGPLGIETLDADRASLSVYGDDVTFTRDSTPPSFEPALRMVLIPMSANRAKFNVGLTQSELFQPAASAPIERGGWALPITTSQPENLATAEGAGSMVLFTGKGLSGSWRGLSNGEASLRKVIIAVDTSSLVFLSEQTVDFRGRQTFELWHESASRRSTIEAKYTKPFFFSFVSSRKGFDSIAFQTELTGNLDRPLKADNGRLLIEVRGTVVLLQDSVATTVGIEANSRLAGGFNAMAVALTNALVTITPVQRLSLNGTLTDDVNIDKGTLALHSGIYQVLPFLPDPYAANFTLRRTQDAPLADTSFQITVTWPGPHQPALEIRLESSNDLLTRMLPEPNSRSGGGTRGGNLYWMLDVSSGADQLGVSWTVPTGETHRFESQLEVSNLSIHFPARHLAAFLLPQFQWEPVQNTFNENTGDFDGQLVSKNDGGPSFFQTETIDLVPVAPVPVVREIVRSYNDEAANVNTVFTLPFGIKASAYLVDRRYVASPELRLLRVPFQDLKGARQISLLAGIWVKPVPDTQLTVRQPVLFGNTEQTINFPRPPQPPLPLMPDNTLGLLWEDFNARFKQEVPIERIEFSGYGASLFSRWIDLAKPDIGITQVSFDAFNGRTAFERIQMVSILWPCVARVVRTIVLERQSSGAVLRWDSGWIATTSGLFKHKEFNNIHKGDIDGMYNIREIRDTTQILKLLENTPFETAVQAVYYDADVAFKNSPVESGQNSAGRVPVRRQLGFIQRVAYPSGSFGSTQAELLTPKQFDALLKTNGPLGGPMDCRIRIGSSQQRKRLTLIQTESAGVDSTNTQVFAVTLYGSPVFPGSGQWSVVRIDNASKGVQPIDANTGVPLIKADGGPYRWADPADLMNPAAAQRDYALLMSHDAQRFLFQRPKIDVNAANISSTKPPLVADPYSMLASTGLFPPIDQAIKLQPTDLVAETLKLATANGKLAVSNLGLGSKTLLDLPAWTEKIDYSTANLFIDSLDNWKIHLGDLKQKLEFEVIGEIMTLVHGFESIAGDASKVLKPEIKFPAPLKAVAEVLDLLRKLAPALPGGIGPFKFSASFAGTTLRLDIVADFKLATKDSDQIECGMGKVRGNLKVGAELTADLIKREIGGAVFLEISGSWQQLIFPAIYGGGHLRFFIRGDHAGKTTLELDACVIGSVGGTLIPGLVDLEATVKYGYYIQVKNEPLPGVIVGMEGRAKLLSGLLGFKFGVEGRALIDPTEIADIDPTNPSQELETERPIKLYGRIRVAGTVTLVWAIEESKSFETDFDVDVDWKTAVAVYKAGLMPVP